MAGKLFRVIQMAGRLFRVIQMAEVCRGYSDG